MTRFFAVIPVKDPDFGKSRLSPLLDRPQRRALNLRLALHTLRLCVGNLGGERTIVVTSSRDIQDIARRLGAIVLNEGDGTGNLNGALRVASGYAVRAGAEGIVVIPTDLPLLSAPLLQSCLAAVPVRNGCVLVPDRRGTGTNLMAIKPIDPELFSFGELSLERHERLARDRGYDVRMWHSLGLSIDVDLPEDICYLQRANVFVDVDSTKWVEALHGLLHVS